MMAALESVIAQSLSKNFFKVLFSCFSTLYLMILKFLIIITDFYEFIGNFKAQNGTECIQYERIYGISKI